MTAIPWTVVDPDIIERMIAVGLCRRHKSARRIKPSQGDGGLDVLVPLLGGSQLQVEVYQVKKFADVIDDSRERQIKKSLKSAIKTHNEQTFGYEVARWHLALPMDLTREKEKWLFDLADDLNCPFPVEVFGLTPVEEMLIEYPNIREYYLGDGLERVRELMAQMSTFAGLEGVSAEPGRVTAGEVGAMLSDLHSAINSADPHFNYGFEVGDTPPVLTPVLGRIASTVECVGADAPYVTWHISTKYDAALEDRSVPGGYTVHPDRMTAEQRVAWERWRIYGAPVELAGDVVEDFTIDLPGGLGSPPAEGEHVLRIGPAAGEFDDEPTTRALWVLEDADGNALADRLFFFRLEGRGMEGGEHRRGVDAEGYISVDLYSRAHDPAVSQGAVRRTQPGEWDTVEPGTLRAPTVKDDTDPTSRETSQDPGLASTLAAGTGTMLVSLHLHSERWVGEPVQRVLPALRFAAAWGDGHVMRPRDEHSLTVATQAMPLAGEPPVPPVVVAAVEDLVRISSAARRPIGVPDRLHAIAEQRGVGLRIIADSVTGLEPEIGVGELEVWYDDVPGALEDLTTQATEGDLVVPWPIRFPLLGEGFTFSFSLEVLSSVTLEPADPPASTEALEGHADRDDIDATVDGLGSTAGDTPNGKPSGDPVEARPPRKAVRVVCTETTRGRLRWHGGRADGRPAPLSD